MQLGHFTFFNISIYFLQKSMFQEIFYKTSEVWLTLARIAVIEVLLPWTFLHVPFLLM